MLLRDVAHIRNDLEYLMKHDDIFARASIQFENIEHDYYGPTFDGLASIIIGQQISTKVAKTIRARMLNQLPLVTPEIILATPYDEMRGWGLSDAKAQTILRVAQAICNGVLDLGDLAEKGDVDGVMKTLTAFKGIGPWTAQLFLLFGIAHKDMWVPGDLGIRKGHQKYLSLDYLPDIAETCDFKSQFEGRGSAAMLLLWEINK
jgi:DNA-3-methyladenine glycosylase II